MCYNVGGCKLLHVQLSKCSAQGRLDGGRSVYVVSGSYLGSYGSFSGSERGLMAFIGSERGLMAFIGN